MCRVCSGTYVHDVLPRAGTAPLKGQTNRSATQRAQLASDSAAAARDQAAATWCLLSSHQPGSQLGENWFNPRPNIRMTAPETRCVLANACVNPSQQVRERGRRDAAAAPSCTPQSLSESGGGAGNWSVLHKKAAGAPTFELST